MHYGYIGVAIGTFFEGEATALLGGIFPAPARRRA